MRSCSNAEWFQRRSFGVSDWLSAWLPDCLSFGVSEWRVSEWLSARLSYCRSIGLASRRSNGETEERKSAWVAPEAQIPIADCSKFRMTDWHPEKRAEQRRSGRVFHGRVAQELGEYWVGEERSTEKCSTAEVFHSGMFHGKVSQMPH